jgi:multidrug efflux pump subunit AcrA (membrane-fusion protein)
MLKLKLLKNNPLKVLIVSLCLLSPSILFAAEIITVGRTLSSSQTVLGSTVVPYKEVTVTAKMPGTITFLGGEVGASFKEGDVLAKIDDSSLLAKRDTLWAQITSAQAALKNSQTQYQREIVSPRSKDISGMPGMGMPAMMDIFMTRPAYEMMGDYDRDYNRYSDLMNSATGVSQAESQLRMAWSQLNELNTKIKDTILIAPFEGIIMSKNVEVGDAVQPGQPLMKYGFIKYLRLKADVPSVLVPSLKKGMEVKARVGQGLTTARISQIYPVADPSRHTVVVKFDLKVGYPANPGMYAEVFLPDTTPGGNSVVTIPTSALIEGRSLPTVLVVDTDRKKSSLRLVRLGAVQADGKHRAVISGLKAGEKIVNNPPVGVTSEWYPGS